MLEGYTLVKVKEPRERTKLKLSVDALKREIKETRAVFDSEMRKDKQSFEEYKSNSNAILKAREDDVIAAEKEIVSIKKDREVIKKEAEDIKSKWSEVKKAQKEADELKVKWSVKQEEAAKVKELYEKKIEELS